MTRSSSLYAFLLWASVRWLAVFVVLSLAYAGARLAEAML